ncbi:hypothetical protein V5O48_012651 [Marasmius crinis-equi]|uniref:Uncharacterized protein n=1 Tax=Marasmius crinis-equi TaxID=585013 RepID=A0ABR3F287_9AGAR
MSSDADAPSKKQRNAGPSPLLISAVAGTIVASIVIPGAIWLRRRKNLHLPGPPPPARQILKRSEFNRLSLGVPSSGAATTPPKREPRQAQAFARLTPTIASSTSFTPRETKTTTSEEELPGEEPVPEQLDFSPALLTVRAFGIATLAVSIGAVGLVWGVKSVMGKALQTEQFARRMRELIMTRMPILSSRIHRSHTEEYEEGRTAHTDSQWNWNDAEERLKDAFDKDGISGWVEVAVKELEAEEAFERTKRSSMEHTER